ncbi:MAG: MFS transporter [Candidatus Lokiarchaeota archaeon]|nr:MFS transporter [Candidatus Lokiarchaeota archaeon]
MANLTLELWRSSKRNRKYARNIWLLYGISFFNGMHFVYALLIPYFVDWGGITFPQIMNLQSIYMITIFLTEIPLGVVSDCVSRKLSLSLGFLITIAAILFYSAIPRFFLFVIAEILWACATSLISGADRALMYDSLIKLTWKNKERNSSNSVSVFGKYTSFNLIGFLISAPIGTIISIYMGLRATMMFMIIPAGIAFISTLFLIEPVKLKDRMTKPYLKLIFSGFQSIWKNTGFRTLVLDDLIVICLCNHVGFSYQQKLRILGISDSNFGWIFMIYIIFTIVGSNIHTPLVKKFHNRRKILFFTTLGAGMGLIILFLSNTLLWMIIGMILVATFGITYATVRMGYYQSYISSDQRSTIISTINMIRLLWLSGINILVGFLSKIDLSLVFIIFGGVLSIWAFISPIKEEYLKN